MITVLSKNQLYSSALCDALKEFNAAVYKNDGNYGDVLVVALEQEDVNTLLKETISCPVLLIGTTHEEADVEISSPCYLYELKSLIKDLLNKKEFAPVFENKRFLFEGAKRRLYDKKSKKDYYLTEKETDLIVFLVKALPEGASKMDLLTSVWKYRPDIETHTVESHVYALRQKIGEDVAEMLLKNTPDGYILETK
ncbi:MAG: helix-turn-helix domain-containing protein [Alphaproteobacteria bacterium]|nr:helix-turn-helix domain-containing protein [Alphaproteobacteria bacterium]